MVGAYFNEFCNYAELVVEPDTGWLASGEQRPSGQIWLRAEAMPTPGTRHLVKVWCKGRQISISEDRWLLFVPAWGAENGWDEYPATIPGSAFVRCRLWAAEGGKIDAAGEQWFEADVIEVVPFTDLERRFPPRRVSQLQTWELSTGGLTRHDDWELWHAPHDDAGFWLVARLDAEDAHVVAAGEWVYGVTSTSEAWAGHVVMPLAAWRDICRRR